MIKKILPTIILYLFVLPLVAEDNPISKNKENIILMAASASEGLGDYAYGVKIYHLLNTKITDANVGLILYGEPHKKEAVLKIYSKEFEENSVIWITNTDSGEARPSINPDEESLLSRFLEGKNATNTVLAHVGSNPENLFPVKYLNGLDLSVKLNITEMFYCDGNPGMSIASEAISGLNDSWHLENSDLSLLKKYWWFTADVFEDESDNDDLENDDLENETHTESDSDLRMNLLGENNYSFGVKSKHSNNVNSFCEDNHSLNSYFSYNGQTSGEQKIGLLLSESQKRMVENFSEISIPKLYETVPENAFKSNHEFLKILSGKDSTEDQIKWLQNDGSYFFSYMHDDLSKLDFISTTLPIADPTKDIKYVTSFQRLEKYFANPELKELIKTLLNRIMEDNSIQRIVFWSGNDNSSTEYIHPTQKGRTLWLINPFPISKPLLDLIAIASSQPVAGCTGDHSFYDIVSIGKLPYYERVPHISVLPIELSDMSEDEQLMTLSDYFDTFSSTEKTKLLKQKKTFVEWQKFRKQLWQNNNGSTALIELFEDALSDL
ncbi:hypothetical protein NX722_22545 [Endozoicomonas gorgoniicola]|uniref:Uncharacterized protein n=1 Tax=Endozoicomonas gorgoniicola TaxID=1234144 RepID=A0ABT3N202_9GAMM|nr:hypothetical protein [Endozoicomonas gorgoniicola]MCW7555358.1 hypothetical protein [Endozoicomonas gorgoniicola]